MKYVLGAVAIALAGPAAAQSSVTLYGIVDLDGQYLSGNAKSVRVTSGGLAGSRLGFKGTEDLGNGVRAEFTLEGGINADEGGSAQGGTLFGRQVFGALKTSAGTFSAGRQYSSIYIITGEFSAFSNTNVGPTTAVLGGAAGGYEPVRGGGATTVPPASGSGVNGGPARVNNSFRYTSPDYAGFKASALYGAGELTGNTWNSRLFDGSLRYTGHGFDAMLSYVDDKALAAIPTNSTKVATMTAAASYAFSAFHVEGGYMHTNDRRADDIDGNGFWLGGDYRVGGNLFKLQWVQNKVLSGVNDNKVNAYGAGYQYDFTKRTALYTSLTRFQNGAGTNLGRFNSAIPANLTTADDNDITEFALGVRHSF